MFNFVVGCVVVAMYGKERERERERERARSVPAKYCSSSTRGNGRRRHPPSTTFSLFCSQFRTDRLIDLHAYLLARSSETNCLSNRTPLGLNFTTNKSVHFCTSLRWHTVLYRRRMQCNAMQCLLSSRVSSCAAAAASDSSATIVPVIQKKSRQTQRQRHFVRMHAYMQTFLTACWQAIHPIIVGASFAVGRESGDCVTTDLICPGRSLCHS